MTAKRRHYTGAEIWMLIALVVVAMFVAFWTGRAHAENKTVTWTNATTNSDSSSIPATGPGSLTRTTVEYGTCAAGNSFGTKAGEIFVAAPAQTLTVNLVVVQMYCLRAFHTNTFGVPSGFSNVAVTSVAPPTPGAPSSLTVTSPTAYEMRQDAAGKAVAYAVGTVPLGALCGTEERIVNGVAYRRVEMSAADLVVWPQKMPLVPWARCG